MGQSCTNPCACTGCCASQPAIEEDYKDVRNDIYDDDESTEERDDYPTDINAYEGGIFIKEKGIIINNPKKNKDGYYYDQRK